MFRLFSIFILEFLYLAYSQSHGEKLLGSCIKTPSDF